MYRPWCCPVVLPRGVGPPLPVVMGASLTITPAAHLLPRGLVQGSDDDGGDFNPGEEPEDEDIDDDFAPAPQAAAAGDDEEEEEEDGDDDDDEEDDDEEEDDDDDGELLLGIRWRERGSVRRHGPVACSARARRGLLTLASSSPLYCAEEDEPSSKKAKRT